MNGCKRRLSHDVLKAKPVKRVGQISNYNEAVNTTIIKAVSAFPLQNAFAAGNSAVKIQSGLKVGM